VLRERIGPAYFINTGWLGRANNQLKDLSKITSFRMDGSFEIWIWAMNFLRIYRKVICKKKTKGNYII